MDRVSFFLDLEKKLTRSNQRIITTTIHSNMTAIHKGRRLPLLSNLRTGSKPIAALLDV